MVTQYLQNIYENEPWKIDHDNAMYCRNVEAAIEIGQKLLVEYDAIGAGEQTTVAEGLRQGRGYQWWLDRSSKLVEAIAELRGLGYSVDRSEPFLMRYNDLAAIRSQLDQTVEALADLDAGKGIRLNPDDLHCRQGSDG